MSHKTIAIKQNGVLLGYVNKSIDFTGTASVISIDSSGRIVVAIVPQILHADNYVVREIPSSSSDVDFTLTYSPIYGTEMIFLNGMLLSPNDDYTLIGAVVTFLFSILSDDQIRATYFY